DDRPVAAVCEPDGDADDAGLRQRGVHDPARAEVALQPVGHPEHAAELAEVLAEQDDRGVVVERVPQARGEGGGHGELRHQSSPSNIARYAAYWLRCRRSHGVGSTKTWSKTLRGS